MVNKVILLGNLGRDPETRTVGTSTVTNIRLATTEKYKDRDGVQKERTEWHTVVAWGPLGQLVQQYKRSGDTIYVEGRLSTRKWQDKDGKDRYNTDIVADVIRFVGGKSNAAPSHGPTDNNEEELPF